MLQIILGRSGTGKTTKIMEEAILAVKENKKVIILVPDQISFETEREALASLSGESSMNMTVLSFSRLAENIFRIYGGVAGKRLTDTAKLISMKLAIGEIGDNLQIYKKQWSRIDFVSTMIKTIDELKGSGTYPEQLTDVIKNMANSQLRYKLEDICEIYRTYQGIIDRDFSDPLDDLVIALKKIRGGDYFADHYIYIDGFTFFSPPQRQVVEVMIEQSEKTTMTFCADSTHGEDDMDIFSEQKKLMKRLQQYTMSLGITCKVPVKLTQSYRHTDEGLSAVESFLASKETEPVTDAKSVTMVKCQDKYDELRYVSGEITRLVREENYRYRDIAIVPRSLMDYESTVETVVKEYHIPLFYDKKELAKTRPIVAVVLSALECVKGNWNSEALLRLAKNPAIGLGVEETAHLENYIYMWSIKKEEWENPFVKPSWGLQPVTKKEDVLLEQVEGIRVKLMTPLLVLKERLKGCDGLIFATGIYEYILESSLLDTLTEYCADEQETLKETDNLYNSILNILDEFATMLGTKIMPLWSLIELFDMSISLLELGKIPNTNDQAVIGSADRIRLANPKIIFAIGMNEGIFPAKYQPQGVFSKAEREQLVSGGIEMAMTPFKMAVVERFFLYATLSGASEKMYITYNKTTLSGGKMEPSLVMSQMKQVVKNREFPSNQMERTDLVVDLFTAREQFARDLGENNKDTAMAQLLGMLKDQHFLSLMANIAKELPADDIKQTTAKNLLGSVINLSPTKIEKYYQCPYLYFCESMLALRKRKKVEYTPLESGVAIHYVLEKMVEKYKNRGIAKLTDEALKAEITEMLHDHITQIIGDITHLEKRFKYQLERLVSLLTLVVRHLGNDLAQSAFIPVGVEVSVGGHGVITAPEYTTSDGTVLKVQGKIDRVDMYSGGDEKYVRIIDYKSGHKEFKIEEVFHGLNMQMLIYLNAICSDQKGKYGKVMPAGILYMPSSVKAVETSIETDRSSVTSILEKSLKMSGLLLEDERILHAMEEELAGKYIPATTVKSGKLSASSKVKSKKEMEHIAKIVDENIVKMGEALTKGEIAPLPVRGSGMMPCEYCDYQVLCKNKGTTNYRNIKAPKEKE